MFEQKYIIMETIGRNSSKMTSIVRNKSNSYFIAKKVPIDDQKTMHEIQMMKSLAHPNIIALHEIIEEENWAYIIEEYCEEGDLQYHLKRQIKSKKLIQEEVVARWLLQILLAIEYLHQLKIIHRDIRPRNIFLTSNGNIKIGSFKVSKLLQNEVNYAQTLINSPYYLTPQLSQDIWAFGCVMYEICTLKTSSTLSNIGQLVKMAKSKIEDLPHNYSKQLNILYQKCMKKSPVQRISARNLLKASYFLEVIEKFIVDKGININFQQKIPIKRYNIHKSKYERIKIKKRLIKEKATVTQIIKKDSLLPKIGVQIHKIQNKFALSKQKSKQKKSVALTPVIKRAKGKEIVNRYENCFSIDVKSLKNDFLKTQTDSLPRPPIISMQDKQKKKPLEQQNQKILLLAPPKLPKPVKKLERVDQERRVKTRLNEQEKIQNFEITMCKQKLKMELNSFQKKQIHQISDGLSKIFEHLHLKQEDDEEIQFDFEEQSQLRLTSKHDEAASLLVTCKSKLEQLIEEINYKYCPDMQPIPEKTTEFDSASFLGPLVVATMDVSQ